MDIDHFRRPWVLDNSGMRDTGCAIRKKKTAEYKNNPNKRPCSGFHVIRG
jgi:hypothetical protein